MKRTFHFAIPGDIATPTGGYAYARRLIEELPAIGLEVEHVALPDGFPFPDAAALAEARARLAALPNGATVLVDGLAFGAMPEIARDLSRRLDLVALVHHVLADETGLLAQTAISLEHSERAALAEARAVICTSRNTARRLADGFDIDRRRIAVAPPGTDRRPPARGSESGAPVIASLGALVPRKGHDVLLKALARLMHIPWTARIAGTPNRDPDWAATLRTLAHHLGLDERVTFLGAVADPDVELASADIFALASWHEGYGMAFAEALAHGLPVVGCDVGGVPEAVPEGAGSLVPAGDANAFAAALAPLLADPEFRRGRADVARIASRALPGWRETASIIARCLVGRG